jgi:hypothetical protein
MDVETILKEIRNRVVSDDRANASTAGTDVRSNGSAPPSSQSESLTRASAHLAVTGRAWDRLPPVFSNRRGTLARIELWIKRKSKPLTRWFTWEQVNFNRAVKDALGDVIEILKAEAQELAILRGQLTHEAQRQAREVREIEARLNQTEAALARVSQLIASSTKENRGRQAELAQQYSQLAQQYSRLENKLSSLVSEHSALELQHSTSQADLQVEHAKLAGQVIELVAQLRAEQSQIKAQQDQEINRRLSDLATDLKEEQRVCFRQVSLEASEAAVLEDRARRSLIERLEKIEAALKAGQRG